MSIESERSTEVAIKKKRTGASFVFKWVFTFSIVLNVSLSAAIGYYTTNNYLAAPADTVFVEAISEGPALPPEIREIEIPAPYPVPAGSTIVIHRYTATDTIPFHQTVFDTVSVETDPGKLPGWWRARMFRL